jgi:hypothetical protein
MSYLDTNWRNWSVWKFFPTGYVISSHFTSRSSSPSTHSLVSGFESIWRMPLWRRVHLLWTDISEERIASIFKNGCSNVLMLVPRSRISYTLKMEAMRYSETSVYTRSTLPHILEYCILHSHHRENHTSYIFWLIFSFISKINREFWKSVL